MKHLSNNIPTRKNNRVNAVLATVNSPNQKGRPITHRDIAFFESVPVIDTSTRLEGSTPRERALFVFEHLASRFPLPIFKKYVSDFADPTLYSYKEITGTSIPAPILESVLDLLTEEGVKPYPPPLKTYMKCIRIQSIVDSKPLDTICLMTKNDDKNYIEYFVMATRQAKGVYSFNKSNEFPVLYYANDDPPIILNLYDTESYIAKINKSDILGFETGTGNVHVALHWVSLFDPEGVVDVTLEDAATVPCGKGNSSLSFLQFITRPISRMSWYNSFGFSGTVETDLERVALCQARIQALPVTEIAEYLDGLMKTPVSESVWYVISLELVRSKNLGEYIMEIMSKAVEAMRKTPGSVKEFFSMPENCEYLYVLPYRSSIPIAYVEDRDHEKPVVHRFPLASEFLYVGPRIGGNRILKRTSARARARSV